MEPVLAEMGWIPASSRFATSYRTITIGFFDFGVTMQQEKIGFSGVGIMGASIAKNMLNAGYSVSVYNRSSGPAAELAKFGALPMSSPTELGNSVGTVLMCVTNGQAVEEVLFGARGVFSGNFTVTRVIDFSTIPPAHARDIGARLQKKGITYLDAPVSGGDVGAKNGTLTIMVGGLPEAFTAALPLLSTTGKKILHTGPWGSGQLTKCVNQLVVAITVAAMTEGLVFAKESGLDIETTLEIISSGAAGSWALNNYAPRLLKGDFAPGFYAKDMLKDLRIALDEASTIETTLPVTSLVKELYTAFCEHDGARLGNHALIRLYEQGLPGVADT